jgi:hypothetical protein
MHLGDGYESSDTDCDDDQRTPNPNFLRPPTSRLSSLSSSPASTPVPSRSASPQPLPRHQFFTDTLSSSYPSDTEDEPSTPLLSWNSSPNSWWSDHRRQWWSRRRRRRSWRITRLLKRTLRSVVRHPLFPSQPITIVCTLPLLSSLFPLPLPSRF